MKGCLRVGPVSGSDWLKLYQFGADCNARFNVPKLNK